jgi:mannose-6-phosphate isomerase-like protein (cupin superfamily)
MGSQAPYSINLDARYAPLELVDVQALVDTCKDSWYNQTLCRVNDCVVRLGVMQGEFHWHKHDEEDEFFYVVEGRFVIDLEGRTVELNPRQGFTVPKGVMHRTSAPERSVILMIEGPGSYRPATSERPHAQHRSGADRWLAFARRGCSPRALGG